MKYTSTVFVSSIATLKNLKVGQWFINEQKQRGQYLGHTSAGCDVVRWQDRKFETRDAKANKHLRSFAKTYGSK